MHSRFRLSLGLVAVAIAAGGVVFAPAGGAAASERQLERSNALCVIVDPLVELGCRGGATRASGAPSGSEPDGTAAPGPTGGAHERDVAAVALSPTTIEYDPRRLALMVRPRTSERAMRALLAQAHVELERAVPEIHAYLVEVSPGRRAAALEVLRESPVVEVAGRDVIAHALHTTPDDSDWAQQVGLRVVGLPAAWDVSRGSQRVTVAVVDTGVDSAEPDLRGAVVPGFNVLDPGAPPLDDHGHGTAVAGVIAARSDNRLGMAGVCWLCSIMPVKVLDQSGRGDDTQVAAGIVWAVDHGAQVVNLSLGAPGDTPELAAAVEYAARKGAIVVAAAGNGGDTVPFYPAAAPSALAVAATTDDDLPYDWSNHGDWIDVAAPGCNIAPLLGGYASFCGTSSAAPIVAGLAALALSVQPAATAAQVRQAIDQAATPLPSFVRFGRINAPQTLAALGTRSGVVRKVTLSPARPTRSYRFPAAAGAFLAMARTPRTATLTLTLVSAETGAPVARAVGPSPLRLETTVAGPVALTVRTSARRPIPVALDVSFSR